MEKWRDIKDYEKMYEVSDCGRVRNKRTKEILKPFFCGTEYLYVSLSKNGKVKNKRISRLVAQAFIPNPENKPQVDHIDTIQIYNMVENLRWCTEKENSNNPLTIVNHSVNSGKNKDAKPIVQYTIYGEFVAEYKTLNQAAKTTRISQTSIFNCCHKKDYYKTAGGYIFQYKDSFDDSVFEEMIIPEKKHKCKPVLQIDMKTNKVIKVWGSAIEAQRQKGYNASSITQCCKGKLNKTSNFYWKYCKS